MQGRKGSFAFSVKQDGERGLSDIKVLYRAGDGSLTKQAGRYNDEY